MRYRGVRVKVKTTLTHISWKAVNPTSGCCLERRLLSRKIAFDDVLSARILTKPASCCCPQEPTLSLYTFSRSPRCPNTWRCEEHVLAAGGAEAAKEWVGAVNARVGAIRHRPRNLLVFVNPYSGAKRARVVWEKEAAPVFERARIKVTVMETIKQDHAKEVLALMKADELAGYQGVVAVGGDGLFQEVVCGLLARRARGCSAAHRIRLGHIPAGSTDAVAYTMHGSRCAVTAALHIALGDRLALDTARVDSGDGAHRHFVCQAGYGFMGDVMRRSEALRCIGPVRYDVTGALQYLRLASYRVALSYREAPSTAADVQQLCTAQCEVCRLAGMRVEQHPSSGRASTGQGPGHHHSSPLSPGGASPKPPAGVPPASAPSPRPGQQPHPHPHPHAHSQLVTSSGPLPGYTLPSGAAAGHGSSSSLASGGASAPASSVDSPHGHGSGGGTAAGMGVSAAAAGGGGGGAGTGHGVDCEGHHDGRTLLRGSADMSAAAGGGGGGVGGVAGTAGGGGGRRASSEGFVDAEGWTHVEGEFVSVMCVVTPCRSDKSKRGIIPNGHLSDGRMYLVLVSRCSHLSFLRFLLRLSTAGLVDRCLPFVRVIPITGLRLSPLPGGHTLGGCCWRPACAESAWNVDGELLADNHVAVSLVRGAVDVFARGLELGR